MTDPTNLVRIAALAALLGGAAPGLLYVTASEPAVAQTQALGRDLFLPGEGDWETYVNGRYGMTISYPTTFFAPAEPPANGDGRRFDGQDARIEVFAWNNVDGETPDTMRRRLIGSQGYEDVTFSDAGNSWLALSGYRGDSVFYEKYMFRGDTVQAFGMEYPVDVRATYDPILEAVEDSFRPG